MNNKSTRCLSMNRHHERCLNMTKSESGFCNSHKIKIFEKPEECPICMESIKEELRPLSCGHWVHMECIGNMSDHICPLCRKDIKSCLSKEILEKINNKRIAEEEEEELFDPHIIRNFLRDYIDEYILEGNDIIIDNNIMQLDNFSIIVENTDILNVHEIINIIRSDNYILT